MSMTQVWFLFSSMTSFLGYFEAQRFVSCQFCFVFYVKDFLFVFHGSGTFKGILSMQIGSRLQQELYIELASWSGTPPTAPTSTPSFCACISMMNNEKRSFKKADALALAF